MADKFEEIKKYTFQPTKLGYTNPLCEYVHRHSLRESDVLQRLRQKTVNEVQRSAMLSAPDEAQLLAMLVKLMNAKKAIEIGIYTGYNMLNIATALPQDGRIVGCDISDECFNVGKPFFEEAGVLHKCDVRIQPALKTLDDLLAAVEGGTFDFIFIDADKPNYDAYYEKSLELLRTGGLIAIDNVLWSGQVVYAEESTNEATACLHRLNQKIHKDKRVETSLLPIADGILPLNMKNAARKHGIFKSTLPPNLLGNVLRKLDLVHLVKLFGSASKHEECCKETRYLGIDNFTKLPGQRHVRRSEMNSG